MHNVHNVHVIMYTQAAAHSLMCGASDVSISNMSIFDYFDFLISISYEYLSNENLMKIP